MLRFFIFAFMFATLASCTTTPNPYLGGIYSDIQGPNKASSNKNPKKLGRSCATAILGMVSTGDASIESARANAKIEHVTAVDYQVTTVLFPVYYKTCTLVTGV